MDYYTQRYDMPKGVTPQGRDNGAVFFELTLGPEEVAVAVTFEPWLHYGWKVEEKGGYLTATGRTYLEVLGRYVDNFLAEEPQNGID